MCSVCVFRWLYDVCLSGIEKTRDALKEWFALQLSRLAHERGLYFGGWEDGLMENELPYNRSVWAEVR